MSLRSYAIRVHVAAVSGPHVSSVRHLHLDFPVSTKPSGHIQYLPACVARAYSTTPVFSSRPLSDSQTISLPDGRTIGYAEYGSATGTPLLYFHGFPTSRLEGLAFSRPASHYSIRLLAIDRPGYGLSTHAPKRSILDWPGDVQAFAAQLGLPRFAVLGVSGGGPYALACAQKIPADMLTAVGVLAGAAPWDKGVRTPGTPWYGRLAYLMGNYWPSGMRVMTNAAVGVARWFMNRDSVKKAIEEKLASAAKAKAATGTLGNDGANVEEKEPQDKSARTPAERTEILIRSLFEPFAQGSAGTVHETRLLSRDWGIQFEKITYPHVQMWHGTKDVNAPIRGVRAVAKRIPHCTLKEYPNDDHAKAILTHMDEVFQEMIPGNANDAATKTSPST